MTRRQLIFAALGGAAVLASILLAVLFAFAPVKTELCRIVLAKTGRTLAIDGDLQWSLWPRLALGVGRTALSEKDGKQEFAHLERASLAVALLPLLSGQVVADRVEIAGLRAAIVMHKDGSLNIDDLFSHQDGGPLQADIAGVRLSDARLDWRDEKSGLVAALDDIQLTSGPIHADTGRHTYRIDDVAVSGRYADSTAKFDLTRIEADAASLKIAQLGMDLDARVGEAAVVGRLDSALEIDLAKHAGRLPNLAGSFAARHPLLPINPMKLSLAGSGTLDLAGPAAKFVLTTEFDGSRLKGRLNFERFSPLALGVDLDIDRLDMDRYRSSRPTATTKAEQPNFAFLTSLGVHGTVRIGSLRVAGVRAADVSLQLGD